MSGKRHLDTWDRRDEAEQKVEELEQKNAELRERVGALEGALQKIAKGALGVEPDGTFVQAHKVAHAALSQANAQAKLENQEEECCEV